jgi:hypothetical protein
MTEDINHVLQHNAALQSKVDETLFRLNDAMKSHHQDMQFISEALQKFVDDGYYDVECYAEFVDYCNPHLKHFLQGPARRYRAEITITVEFDARASGDADDIASDVSYDIGYHGRHDVEIVDHSVQDVSLYD